MNSAPFTSFTVSLFWNEDCDSLSGYGEGKYFIGNLAVPTDGSGHGAFSSTFPIYVPPGKFITGYQSLPVLKKRLLFLK